MRARLETLALRPAAAVGGLLLAAVALLTVVDVALRYVLNAPIRGTFELTELAMVGIVFLGLGRAQHIEIDLLYERLASTPKRVLNLGVRGLSLALTLLITWQLGAHLLRTRAQHEVTAVLHVPVFVAVGLAVLGFGLFALRLVADHDA
jgi:TRAP-type C4-dicarboxylate transport system permease small subunit